MQMHNALVAAAMAVIAVSQVVDAAPRTNTIVTMQEGDMYKIYKDIYVDDAFRAGGITSIKKTLIDHAKDSQYYVLKLLSKHSGVKYQSFWISNQLVVYDASPDLVKELAKTKRVQEVRQEEIMPLPTYPVPVQEVAFNGTQSFFSDIKVSSAWDQAFTGKGLVVGSIGSGVQYAHKALRPNFQQYYGWFDPVDKSTSPTDFHGISTHAVGIMVGRDGTGVAPDAHWMACKACQDGGCLESHLLECAQFMTCPTKPNGADPDCHKGPLVIHNAWTGDSKQATFFRNVFRLWEYVSKTAVFAAGDKGSECGLIGKVESTPSVYTVGAANQYKLTSFSSRGVSQVANYEVKPNIIAPGVNVFSLTHDKPQGNVQVTGTQAASAVAAGSLLLLLSQRPSLASADVRQIFMLNAVAMKTNEGEMEGDVDCGATSDASSKGYPNANMGWGNVHIAYALDVLKIKSTVADCRILGREQCLARKYDCDWYFRESECAWKHYVPPQTAYCNSLKHKMCSPSHICYYESYDEMCYPMLS